MERSELTFKKKLISVNSIYDYINTVAYEIFQGEKFVSLIEIKSTWTAEFNFDSQRFYIKPVIKFFILRRLEFLSEENIKLGDIHFGGWTWVKPKIVLIGMNEEKWQFDTNSPSIFQRRENLYRTNLKFNGKTISYKFELGDFLSENTKNDCLREVKGIINFDQSDFLVAILGIYLNELLIFDEMDK